ncbi:alpha/beta hydrolase fold domain-containing protein [Terrisporobacter glycolicus]|uniref:Acetyl esterase n=1 Tax=Terrisporobacter glycolicus ATCC 14880 = DSM 1288 TaxID=1121315 RepID=A0ABZ2EWB9_9FIRM|nr:alpha/beta hydrolase fold domain-containing protein [Terrisporobacter glycolicus]
MKQELIPVYEEMEEQIKKISNNKAKKSEPICISGKPIYLPLNGHKIEVTYYKAKKKNAPIIFGVYGGEFTTDNYYYDDLFWHMIHSEFECNVVSISYKNFRKSKFPCAINDVYDVICYFMENASQLDFNTNKVIIFGSSIGANFATSAALLDRANNTNYIKTQILNYPYLDLTTSINKNICGDFITPDKYVNDVAELKNPFVSPIYASQEELKGMPKTIIICGEEDNLSYESEKYAKMLQSSGTEVYCQNYSEMEAGFVELYFLLKYMPLKSQTLSNKMKENFISGKLYKSVMSAIQFIKEHVV